MRPLLVKLYGMFWLALTVSLIFAALAALHAAWAFEVWWPIREERKLVAAVVGFQEATRMPGAIPCGLVVAVMLTMITLIWLPDSLLRDIGMGLAAGTLLIRGGLAYVPQWRRLTTQTPFARNDVWFYGPLCLTLGVAMLILGFAAAP